MALVVASRVASEEFAGGILNILTWPMMLFSGVWFSLEGTNPVLQKVAQLFPLTHMVDASRAIMTEGAGLADIGGHLTILAALAVVFMAASSILFRWE
jgi:ABC-type multidrug transport system permease subunit